MSIRSLLDGSDTISIDTAVVSSQEFGCLLDMVYTGKLPLGKHNVSRVVAAADSLQMFDVAVGFKNVLTSLVNQQPPAPASSTETETQTPTPTLVNKLPNTEVSDSHKDESSSGETESKAKPKREECQPDSKDTEEPAFKRVCLDRSESPGQCRVVATSTDG